MKAKFLLTLVVSAAGLVAAAQDQTTLRKKHFNLDGEVALSGYDPVGYFKQGKAIKGRKEFAVSAEGIIYYLSSAENKEEFKKNYQKYEPQYGGWCAYAMGNDGSKVEVDPETFKIKDGKLFLFYNKFFTNTLKSWNKDEAALNSKADASWQKIYH